MILQISATAYVHVCFGLVTVLQCKVACTELQGDVPMLQHGHVSMALKGGHKSVQPV